MGFSDFQEPLDQVMDTGKVIKLNQETKKKRPFTINNQKTKHTDKSSSLYEKVHFF